MIYIDSSVLLAYILVEDRAPSADFFLADFVSSRLLEYETVNRMYARGAAEERRRLGLILSDGVRLIELDAVVLARALYPWPTPIRTSDGLHLATVDFLLRQGEPIELASYDNGMLDGAKAMGVSIASL